MAAVLKVERELDDERDIATSGSPNPNTILDIDSLVLETK
jgi:hypothetical protein